MRIEEVVDRLLEYHPRFPEDYDGCDEYKCGDPKQECTGVISALTANITVIRQAIAKGANLIVVHEPLFYTSADKGGWYEEFDNRVYEEKMKLLRDNGIVVWRDHDHMHAHRPDTIFTGVLKYLGWSDKAEVRFDSGVFAHYLVQIDPCRVEEVADYIIERCSINGARIVGDRKAVVSRIAFVGHLFPQDYIRKDGTKGEYSVKVIETLEKDADLIIPGEVIDWTVLSYIRDAADLGLNKAALCIGHYNWEELGMKYLAEILEDLVGKEVNVEYVPSEDMYDFVLRREIEC